MPELANPSVAEFSVLKVFARFLCSNAINYGRMSIAFFQLLEVPHVSDSTD